MSSLVSLFACGEIGFCLMQYLGAEDAINLTRTSTQLYMALPRNSAFGVSVWKLYLSKNAYISNRLVFEAGKFLIDSDQVSRANYKLILCVLVEKNGFMKTLKLKSLCASGKLSTPLIPRSGRWRDLVRIDQFALKRAASSLVDKPTLSACNISLVSFVSRLAGRPGKESLVSKHVSPMPFTDVSKLISLLLENDNFPGVSQIIALRDFSESESLISNLILLHRGSLGDNIFHQLLRRPDLSKEVKFSSLTTLLKFSCIHDLLHERNLQGETPLHLSGNMFDLLVKHGAPVHVPNNKGELAQKGG